MKRQGILNAPLSGHLAGLGHTDRIVIGDCGLPRPDGVPVVDLAVTFGVPSLADLVTVLADELIIEEAALARETAEQNPAAHNLIVRHFGKPRWITHDGLKAEAESSHLFVRTGEAAPYANVILTCGVPF